MFLVRKAHVEEEEWGGRSGGCVGVARAASNTSELNLIAIDECDRSTRLWPAGVFFVAVKDETSDHNQTAVTSGVQSLKSPAGEEPVTDSTCHIQRGPIRSLCQLVAAPGFTPW